MDLNKFKTFIAIAELGSLTSAAAAVNLTQSAVSQQLKEMESELCLKLLDRSRRPIALTSEGVEFAKIARQILHYWQDYKEKKSQEVYKGKVSIGYVSRVLTKVLAFALKELRQKHPQLIIQLINTFDVTRHLTEMVVEKKIDACFGIGPLPPEKGLLWKPYAVERFFVITTEDTSLKTDAEVISKGPYLRFAPNLLAETRIDREIKRRGIKVEPAMEIDSYASLLLMVKHGIGVGIIPESYLTTQDHNDIFCIPFCVPPLVREMGLIVRHDNHNLHLVDALWKTMYHLFNRTTEIEKIHQGQQINF